ncbi:hypothetical protein [uncultured Shewanella sp.]|uniref:hypothetical protein n=1 Tax=uncultured Shewanella sp. TaxID=173975 RepID=UPI0026279BA6|nr:hypothetical protein [uncultured Shewanella sp.]
MNKLHLLILFLPFLFSCTKGAIYPQDFSGKITDSFTTSIANNGLKLFTYRVSLSSMSNSTPNVNSPSNGLAQKHKQRNDQLPSKIQRKQNDVSTELLTEQTELGLKKTLEMTDFCHTGYIELDRLIEDERGMIRGECLEGANTLDKQKFDSL